jgi:hypothetical protein
MNIRASGIEPIGNGGANGETKMEPNISARETVTGASLHPLLTGSFRASPEYSTVQRHVPTTSGIGARARESKL